MLMRVGLACSVSKKLKQVEVRGQQARGPCRPWQLWQGQVTWPEKDPTIEPKLRSSSRLPWQKYVLGSWLSSIARPLAAPTFDFRLGYGNMVLGITAEPMADDEVPQHVCHRWHRIMYARARGTAACSTARFDCRFSRPARAAGTRSWPMVDLLLAKT